MSKVLIIDDSPVFREYLRSYLVSVGLDVVVAINGLDGAGKIRNESPDLVIMDFYISRKSAVEVLQEKHENPNTTGIPVFLVASRIERNKLARVAGYNVKKVLGKPLKIDLLVKNISEALKFPIEIDDTPCSIDAHINDQIMFVEIARGLNREKLFLLKFKVAELIRIHKMKTVRMLIMMTGVSMEPGDGLKLQDFLQGVIEGYGINPRYIRILTTSNEIKAFLRRSAELKEVDVVSSLEDAMDGLLGRRGLEMVTSEKDNLHERLFSSKGGDPNQESILMRFDSEENISPEDQLKASEREFRIAVVDDDQIVHEIVKNAFLDTQWELVSFEDGKEFADADLKGNPFDLVFLDIMMPRMNGFQVLQYLKKEEITTPVIILSALSRRDSVMKAMNMGVNSYMVKPIKPQDLLRKAAETLVAL